MTSSERTSRRYGTPVPAVADPERIIRSGSRSRPGSQPGSRIPSPRRVTPSPQLATPPASTAQTGQRLACASASHLFDGDQWTDVYELPAGSGSFFLCLYNPCPNRYNEPRLTPRPNQSWGLAIANSQEEAIRGHQERTTPAPSNPLTFPPIQTPQPQQLSASTVVDLTYSPPAAEPELEPEQELEPEAEELVAEPEQRSRTHSPQSHHPRSESAMSTNTNGSSGERGSKPEDFTGE